MMELIPFSVFAFLAFVLGTIIGSFASVLACRMRTGSSMNTRSHCLSCGRTLVWYEMVPVLSYVFLRGRCRTCTARIPYRDILMEVVTGLSFVAIVYSATDVLTAILLAIFITAVLIGAAYDLQHCIIPDEIVWWSAAAATGIVLVQAWYTGEWSSVLWSTVSAAAAFVGFALLWGVSGGRWMGFGDAKLAAPLAALVGPLGAFSLVVLAFWIGAAVSVTLLGYQYVSRALRHRTSIVKYNGYFTMKSEVPFAPFLIVAFYLVFFFSVDVLTLTQYAFN